LQKQPKITAVESGQFISEHAKRQLQRATWRARHTNLSNDQNIDTIDLTQETEENPNPDNTEQVESTPIVYTTTITKLFIRIEQHLLTIGYIKEKPNQQIIYNTHLYNIYKHIYIYLYTLTYSRHEI